MVQKATGLENTAKDTSAAENKSQTGLLNNADATYGQFQGSNMTNSPFYKSLVTSGTDATTSAYQNAKSNMAAKSNAAGFGYGAPAAQGGNQQMAVQEASDVGKIPLQATQTAADYAMKGAAGEQTSAGQMGDQALGYQSSATQLQNQRRANNAAMLNQLMKTAGEVGTAGISKWG